MSVWTKRWSIFFFQHKTDNTKNTTILFYCKPNSLRKFFFSFLILRTGSKSHAIYHCFCCSNNSLHRLQKQKHPGGLTTSITKMKSWHRYPVSWYRKSGTKQFGNYSRKKRTMILDSLLNQKCFPIHRKRNKKPEWITHQRFLWRKDSPPFFKKIDLVWSNMILVLVYLYLYFNDNMKTHCKTRVTYLPYLTSNIMLWFFWAKV